MFAWFCGWHRCLHRRGGVPSSVGTSYVALCRGDFVDAPALTPAPLPQAGERSKPAAEAFASGLQTPACVLLVPLAGEGANPRRKHLPEVFKLPLACSLSRLRERVGVRAGASTK
ncbi:protein of unknown function (plasmid) [Cupriavidus taiwanensis]|uniref:Uncharacterized protein n=1 Tax=Cupriavidus taiwanensis TaxID=164546 RepID=A0A375ILR4_9BURK|nr:hypothetical protein CBM2629_B40427 [Cupriavidus taiwanensis]SPK75643.1 protein of unknown function [Cupriavidus taiwanensis]